MDRFFYVVANIWIITSVILSTLSLIGFGMILYESWRSALFLVILSGIFSSFSFLGAALTRNVFHIFRADYFLNDKKPSGFSGIFFHIVSGFKMK